MRPVSSSSDIIDFLQRNVVPILEEKRKKCQQQEEREEEEGDLYQLSNIFSEHEDYVEVDNS